MAKRNNRTAWTVQELADFRRWHECRMDELNYPDNIKDQLRKDRDKFLPAPSDK